MQIFLICVYFLVYFCVYFFTRVFHTCFSHGICVQYGGFPRMKPMCNAAMPGAFTVDSEDDYSGFEIYFYVQLPLGQPKALVWLPIEYFGCRSSCPSSSQETNTGS